MSSKTAVRKARKVLKRFDKHEHFKADVYLPIKKHSMKAGIDWLKQYRWIEQAVDGNSYCLTPKGKRLHPKMAPGHRVRAIGEVFQRSMAYTDQGEIEFFTLDELKEADAGLGQVAENEGYRKKLKERIASLEVYEQRAHEKRVRWQDRIWGFVFGVFTTLVGAMLTNYLID